MPQHIRLTYVEWILLLTAFAAGSVDVIGFAELGRVFASAMTGNFALLAYHVARGDSASVMGSVIALCGFVLGCAVGFMQRRGRSQDDALTLLLGSEAVLLLLFALYAILAPDSGGSASEHFQIALLAVAMGLQAVIGQAISLTTIVFTMTITKLVGAVTNSIADAKPSGLRDVKIQSSVVVSYLCGALLAAAMSIHRVAVVVMLPLFGVALALAVHWRELRRKV
jgi:uncharacterized membrane protein YoaK (UPF0700 family)